MSANKPAAQTLFPWLRANLGNGCLAPLTSTDAYALRAAVQIIELYGYHRDDRVMIAFGKVVGCMQGSTSELAYHAIAHVLNWDDREPLWNLAGLPPIEHPSMCKFEPDSRIFQVGGQA